MEIWKDVVGFEGLYQVSNHGRVKSLSRHVENGSNKGMILKERILKVNEQSTRYSMVILRKNNTGYARYVHRLVAEAFLGEIKETVNHKDGDKHNNHVDNLELCTYSQNNQHAYDVGLHKKGEEHYKSKLSNDQVRLIRKEGKYSTYREIAKKYNSNAATIRDILENITRKGI